MLVVINITVKEDIYQNILDRLICHVQYTLNYPVQYTLNYHVQYTLNYPAQYTLYT